jgi:nucleotide-binding universal stress UspA family protein
MAAEHEQLAAQVEQAATEIASQAGVSCTFKRRDSTPADAILAEASVQAAADHSGSQPVIVVGRSGHAARHMLGSVPVQLLHHSACPVLTIP